MKTVLKKHYPNTMAALIHLPKYLYEKARRVKVYNRHNELQVLVSAVYSRLEMQVGKSVVSNKEEGMLFVCGKQYDYMLPWSILLRGNLGGGGMPDSS